MFIDTLLIGISSGAIYSLMALALVLVWVMTAKEKWILNRHRKLLGEIGENVLIFEAL